MMMMAFVMEMMLFLVVVLEVEFIFLDGEELLLSLE